MLRIRKLAASVFASGLMAVIVAAPAGAQTQDGLVNVMIGDVTILQDVNAGVAANAAVTACDLDVGPLALAVLGRAVAVDRSGRSQTICTTDQGPVTITQN
jgi:hypothetical protein